MTKLPARPPAMPPTMLATWCRRILASPEGGGRKSRSPRDQKLGIEQRRPGGATDDVVPHSDELVAQDGAAAYATDMDRHAAAFVHVEARLRAVLRRVQDDRIGRGRWQPALLWLR